MEEARRLGLRPVLVALTVAFAVVAIWAATAFAAGGSSSSSGSATNGDPVAEFVGENDDSAPSADDCPDRSDGSDDGADSSGASSSDT